MKECPHCQGETMCKRGTCQGIIFNKSQSCPTCLEEAGYEPEGGFWGILS
jgi:hypothetical protein